MLVITTFASVKQQSKLIEKLWIKKKHFSLKFKSLCFANTEVNWYEIAITNIEISSSDSEVLRHSKNRPCSEKMKFPLLLQRKKTSLNNYNKLSKRFVSSINQRFLICLSTIQDFTLQWTLVFTLNISLTSNSRSGLKKVFDRSCFSTLKDVFAENQNQRKQIVNQTNSSIFSRSKVWYWHKNVSVNEQHKWLENNIQTSSQA